MIRLMGLVLALGFVAVGPSARAQTPGPMSGGFGFEYTQPMPSNAYVLDRWWQVQGTPSVGSALPPPVMVRPPATVQPASPVRTARAGRMGRTSSRLVPRSYYPVSGPPVATPLPTGSLYWPAAGMPLYSPAQRYAAYGQGYGVSPYGSADYGAQFRGMYWPH